MFDMEVNNCQRERRLPFPCFFASLLEYFSQTWSIEPSFERLAGSLLGRKFERDFRFQVEVTLSLLSHFYWRESQGKMIF